MVTLSRLNELYCEKRRLEDELTVIEAQIADEEQIGREADVEPGNILCPQCRGTGLAGERESCWSCDGYGEYPVASIE